MPIPPETDDSPDAARPVDCAAPDARLPDPRAGDVEDDVSSPKARSFAAIAGSLVSEISIVKLLVAWAFIVVVPGVLLGLAPLVATAWFTTLSAKIAAIVGFGPLLGLVIVIAIGWFGGRPVWRAAERSFWSLNSLAVQPGYALCREGLQHVVARLSVLGITDQVRERLRAATALGAGVLCLPSSRWSSALSHGR